MDQVETGFDEIRNLLFSSFGKDSKNTPSVAKTENIDNKVKRSFFFFVHELTIEPVCRL
jgi:hypothetical protein